MSLSQAKRMCRGRVLGLMYKLHQYMTASLDHLSNNVMTQEQKEFFHIFPFATKEAYTHPNKNTMVLSFLTVTNTQYLSSFQDRERMLQAYAQFFPAASESPSDYHDYPTYPDINGRPDSNTPFLARIKRDMESVPRWLTVSKPQYSKRIKKNIAASKLDTIYSRH